MKIKVKSVRVTIFIKTLVMLPQAGLCWFMLVYAGLCWFMLVYAGLCWFMLVYAGLCWFMLVHAGLQPGLLDFTAGISSCCFDWQ